MIVPKSKDNIQPGDVFVAVWGKKNRVHVILRTGRHTSPVLLQTGKLAATYHKLRSQYGMSWNNQKRWSFVGNVPEGWRDEVMHLMKNGIEK